MFKSLVAAFSMYSKIPMPKTKWDEKSMRYALCFFPLVGVAVGAAEYLAYALLGALGAGVILTAAVMSVLPVLITGGIHMDGFLDTVDALSSHRTREERLNILKDPHLGAFAVIYGIVYYVLYFGMLAELVEILRRLEYGENKFIILTFSAGFVLSRILSGLSVIYLKKAKSDGTVYEFADRAAGRAGGILIAELVLILALLIYSGIALNTGTLPAWLMLCVCVSSAAVSAYFYRMERKCFGGITGDLCGYYLQLTELFILPAIVAAYFIVVEFL